MADAYPGEDAWEVRLDGIQRRRSLEEEVVLALLKFADLCRSAAVTNPTLISSVRRTPEIPERTLRDQGCCHRHREGRLRTTKAGHSQQPNGAHTHTHTHEALRTHSHVTREALRTHLMSGREHATRRHHESVDRGAQDRHETCHAEPEAVGWMLARSQSKLLLHLVADRGWYVAAGERGVTYCSVCRPAFISPPKLSIQI